MRNKILESTIDKVINESEMSNEFKNVFKQYIKNKFDNNATEGDFKRVLTLIDDEEDDTL